MTWVTIQHYDTGREGAYVLTPSQSLTGGEETRELSGIVSRLIQDAQPRIILNLTHVSSLNLVSIDELQYMDSALKEKGEHLRLANVHHRITIILEMAGHISGFDSYATVNDALKVLHPQERD